ncbi:MAG: DUF4870 domain-containing protein [Pirellulales bacterium]
MSEVEIPPPTNDERLWATLAHASYFVLGIIGPLVIWLMKKDESAYVAAHAKEALNFQLAVTIVAVVSTLTCVGAPLAIVAGIGGIVYSILAAIEANAGRLYQYPYSIRMIS